MSDSVLPTGPASLQATVPAYAYEEYNDDVDIQGLFTANNALMGEYISWFNLVNLSVYTSPYITGTLLDWTAAGIYGLYRPSFSTGKTVKSGPFNTYQFNQRPVYNAVRLTTTGGYVPASDDLFKRYLTWETYLGDGKTFSTVWLKRRLTRFLFGPNGTDPGVSTTQYVSVTYSGTQVNIVLPLINPISTYLQTLIESLYISLPVQYTYVVTLGNIVALEPLSLSGSTVAPSAAMNFAVFAYPADVYSVQVGFSTSNTVAPTSWSTAETTAVVSNRQSDTICSTTAPSTAGSYTVWARLSDGTNAQPSLTVITVT